MELTLQMAFKTLMEPITGPEVILFKRLQTNWEFLDQSATKSAVDDDLIAPIISSGKEEVINSKKILKECKELREDYKNSSNSVSSSLEHTVMRSRFPCSWTSSPCTLDGESDFCSRDLDAPRIVQADLKKEAESAKPVHIHCQGPPESMDEDTSLRSGPRNDLLILKSLHDYNLHETVGKAALNKFSAHLWDLSEDVALSFYETLWRKSVGKRLQRRCPWFGSRYLVCKTSPL